MPDSVRHSFRSAWILGGALVLSALLIAIAVGNFNKAGDDITVTGSAKREVAADFVVWPLDVRSQLPTQAEASRVTREGAAKVKAFLTEKGFPDSAITIRAPMTMVENEYINGNSTGRVIGYSVVQQIELRSADIDRVAGLAGDLDALIGSTRAAVVANPPQYLINKLSEIRAGLTADATRDAQTRAEEILKAVNAKPGRLKAVRVGVVQITRRNSTEVNDYGMYDTSDRLKEVTAVVRVTFAVK